MPVSDQSDSNSLELTKVLQKLLDTSINTSEEMKKLREYRHDDANNLQSTSLSMAEINRSIQIQAKTLDDFKSDTGTKNTDIIHLIEKTKSELESKIEATMSIVAGPPGKPKEGLTFQVTKFQETVDGIHRLLWILVTASIVGLVTLIFNTMKH